MSVTAKTQLLGLFGWPVSHSFSPAMHNAAIAALGIDYVYLPLPVAPENLQDAVAGLSAMDFAGVNVTIPHKQAIMPFLSEVSDAAKAIGAVNTLVRDGKGGYAGHNTDWTGFLADLEEGGVSAESRDAIILGAGGSARAIVYALLKQNARIHILARRPAAAAQLCDDMRQWFPNAHLSPAPLTDLATLSTASPLIINTTPLGMFPKVNASVWPDNLPIPTGAFVYDLVYNPAQTKLMRQAATAGCQSANGLGMLLHQGAHALKLFTGHAPDLKAMQAPLPFSSANTND